MDGKPQAGALRRGRYSESGRSHLVTSVTLGRRPVFCDLAAARVLVRALRREQEQKRASTLAYVVMPDHFHWLLTLGEKRSLSVVVRAVKAVTAHELGARSGRPVSTIMHCRERKAWLRRRGMW